MSATGARLAGSTTPSVVPASKQTRIQTYLGDDLVKAVRQRAMKENRPESREVSRLVQLGLQADAKQYVLGGQAFRTKADVQAHVRAIRDAATLGEPIDDPVVLALLKLHPEWDEKTENGEGWVGTAMISHPSKQRPSKEIAICFSDVTKVVDISWTKLLPFLQKGVTYEIESLDNPLAELRLAARFEIEPQIRILRKPGHEVDHVFPLTFEKLLYDWLVYNRFKVCDVSIAWESGVDTGRMFANRVLAESWGAWHATHAVLETLPKDEHAKRTQRAKLDWSALMC